MSQNLTEVLANTKLAKDLAQEFNIPVETAAKRILIALNNPDFTDSIYESMKNYLNKIENLVVTDGRIEIVSMDN
ncbi:MAG TPA: hypothetical protein PL048_03245 [Leptospiraceae bacterium]|nr:hypothetical protein [Leptospiraceae bacterium]HMY65958.1 hypothetical protein [Leptospiraceae bacterium]HMZ57764.1 hypothetical protein [Leptospiraceae bacterium]HNF14647.1 hypothetical protein [Leptospiraceae bacterium]HNF23659.1 hypothetical protein [Leptospiraceae bacterium]